MPTIVLTDEELKLLEKRFGPCVRQMGPWNSDGIFGYSSVPIAAVEKAAEPLKTPDLIVALFRLKQTPERNEAFINVLETFGPRLDRGHCCHLQGILQKL